MKKTVIKEANGALKGTIEIYPNGNKIARARNGRFLGTYDAKMNVTRDAAGRIVSRYGDVVVTLLDKE